MSAASLQGKVLITGGAGFIGRAIIGRAEKEGWNAEFTIYSRDEQKQDMVRRRFGRERVRCVLGDIRDPARLRLVASGHDVCIHAAALKYIPEAEVNVKECIEINTVGSWAVVDACRDQVEQCILLSTDKAVMPLNVYGASKMLAERTFVEASEWSQGTQYGVVRYGNVIGSTGSVITVFQRLAAEGKLIELTDENMTRFWLTHDEAIDLIIEAVITGYSEKSFVLIPQCRSMSLLDVMLAAAPGTEHRVIGHRPGEKLHEHLLSEYEATKAYEHNGYIHLLPLADAKAMTSPYGRAIVSEEPLAWMTVDEMAEAIEAASLV